MKSNSVLEGIFLLLQYFRLAWIYESFYKRRIRILYFKEKEETFLHDEIMKYVFFFLIK